MTIDIFRKIIFRNCACKKLKIHNLEKDLFYQMFKSKCYLPTFHTESILNK